MQLRQFRDGVIFILGAIAALKVGSIVVSAPAAEIALLTASVLALGWMIWGGNSWWVPAITGATMGGTIQFGFKIYPIDIGLLLAVIGLLPLLLLAYSRVYLPHRRPLPLTFYAAGTYFTVRVALDAHDSGSGLGNMLRILADIVWPFFFGFIFYNFGRTSAVSAAIASVAVVSGLRIVGNIVGLFFDSVLYIPGINYIIAAGPDGIVDLRSCSFFMLITSLIFLEAARHVTGRLFWLVSVVGSIYLVLLGGSRFSAAIALLVPVIFFVASRRWQLVAVCSGVMLGLLVLINYQPAVLERLPETAERSLSGLLLQPEKIEAGERAEGSTQWHEVMRQEGFRRWTSSPRSWFIGYDLKPFREDAYYNIGQYDEEAIRAAASADVGGYESGLWTVLATMGSVGYLFYFIVFLPLWWRTVSYLLRHRVRTVQDGMILWATYASISWYLFGFTAGSYPSLELALMIIASALVQDMKIGAEAAVESAAEEEIAYASGATLRAR